MALTVNVGFSQKLGQPDYGSIGASCHVECELDGGVLGHDPNIFQQKVQELYAACAQAVEDELGRHQAERTEAPAMPANGSRKATKQTKAAAAPEKATPNGATNHHASSRQLDYLQQLARQIPAVGVRKLESLSQRICGKPMASLSSFDASSLIDTLKAVKEGRLDVDAALKGEGA
jgi:hypothetical protein